MARVGWKALSAGFARLFSPDRTNPESASRDAFQILAMVRQGPNRLLLQALSRDAGWALTLSETLPSIDTAGPNDVPAVVIYDYELSPCHWREIVSVLTKRSPRPYVILLSPNADANLWDELQRVGGSDILRTPANEDSILWAVKRAWRLWSNQRHIRSHFSHPL